ncbi:MAG: glucose 1-dehydrogenase [Alphaproteobacteria bacterium]|nr:glucose 1-dehydrogenase [Alphaproteobacteria bacterium]
MILQDKIALVTGGGVGIGAASAKALADAGARIVVADIDRVPAEAMAKTITDTGGSASALTADCGDVADIQAMIDKTVEVHGQLDIILNNAGITRRASIMDITEADWDRIHRVNAKGVFFCLQAAAAAMIKRGCGGRIINIASIAGRGYSGTSNAAYAASKGAVISLTKTAAQQLARHGINVNAVCPGVTNTALSQANLNVRAEQEGVSVEEMTKRRAGMIPLGRPNEPEDIAAMVVFLASPAARNITGQAYNVDGGIIPG